RAAISARSRASLSSFSVIAIRVLFDSRAAIIGAREWGVNADAGLQDCDRLPPSKRRGGIRCGAFLWLMRVPVSERHKREVPLAKIDLDSLSIEELANLRENATDKLFEKVATRRAEFEAELERLRKNGPPG